MKKYEIQKRLFKAGTHKVAELWFITSDKGRFIEQGPYGTLEEAVQDTRQPYYEETKPQIQLGLDMVIDPIMVG